MAQIRLDDGRAAFAGRVGIGTTSPLGSLHIAGHAVGDNPVMTDGNDRPGVAITGDYPQVVLMSRMQGNPNHGPTVMLGSYDAGSTTVHQHWSIGTAGVNASFLDIGHYGGVDPNPHAGVRNHAGQTVMTLLSSGNVGIGTLGPTEALDVAGSVRVTGTFIRPMPRHVIYTYDATTNGTVPSRTFSFTKHRSDTTVRVVWYDNFRCAGNGVACRWDVRFDGQNCGAPGPIRQDMYNAPDTNFHRGLTVVGFCDTLANGQHLDAGVHTITIVEGASPSHAHGSPVLGWNWANNDGTTAAISVEEVY